MKLPECKYGILVINKEQLVGMVVGITQNSSLEPIPLVQWQDGKTYAVHNVHIEPLLRT